MDNFILLVCAFGPSCLGTRFMHVRARKACSALSLKALNNGQTPVIVGFTFLCLCHSVNYKEEERTTICELNDKGIVGAGDDTASLLPMQGFIFGQLFNLTVSKRPLKLVFLWIISCRT